MKFHQTLVVSIISLACSPLWAATANTEKTQDEPAEQVLESSETHTPYVSEIREGTPIVSQYWTGYRIVRRGSQCTRIEHQLAGEDHVKTPAGTLDLPSFKLTEFGIACPPNDKAQEK